MGKKFKSFNEIADKYKNLEYFIKNHNDYRAHFIENGGFESLAEHNALTNKYWLEIVRSHNLESLINTITEQISKIIVEDNNNNYILFGDYIKEMFWATMYFHDFGKINDNFQVKRMFNPNFNIQEDISFDAEHSKLSSFLFFNYYFDKVYFKEKKFSNEEKFVLVAITLLFSNSILRHHSSYVDKDLHFNEEDIRSCFLFNSKVNIALNEEHSNTFLLQSEKAFSVFQKKVSFNSDTYFNLFALLKLSYSFLTASDYYATSEYMNDLKISSYGVLNKNLKNRIIKSFTTNKDKPYNKDLIENTQKYIDIPFDSLQVRNNENLNLLRQKIGAEAINNLRANSNKNLFYLEAPTGSGKTNISIAIATELLKLDKNLSKIFYVFPFTTLVTQTFRAIKKTIDIEDEHIIQLHSKTGLPEQKNIEGEYGNEYKNYIDYLFANYPIAVLTHVRFFDIIKGNSKETNYLLHRFANSIIIIDELQSYPPIHWDKIIYFLSNYSKLLNIKIIIMSATLPKIDELNNETKGKIVELTTNRDKYFLNPNFKDRVDFKLLDWPKPKSDSDKNIYLEKLADYIFEKSEYYASKNKNKVRTVVEFISKRTASRFLSKISNNSKYNDFAKYLISGEILESRRNEVIQKIKNENDNKVIVITTQVIEAGVDIDMDIGFKDKSLIDSEEQLAGRINRESKKQGCFLYIFDLDKTFTIYRKDYRYDIQTKDEWISKNYLNILKHKKYQELYKRVNDKINLESKDDFDERSDYWKFIADFNLKEINRKFKLIDQETHSLFIPLSIHKKHFNKSDLKIFDLSINKEDSTISGEEVFDKYVELIENREMEFVLKRIDLKRLAAIISQFTISIFNNFAEELRLNGYRNPEKEKYGYLYLSNWELIYGYKTGFNMEKIKTDMFL